EEAEAQAAFRDASSRAAPDVSSNDADIEEDPGPLTQPWTPEELQSSESPDWKEYYPSEEEEERLEARPPTGDEILDLTEASRERPLHDELRAKGAQLRRNPSVSDVLLQARRVQRRGDTPDGPVAVSDRPPLVVERQAIAADLDAGELAGNAGLADARERLLAYIVLFLVQVDHAVQPHLERVVLQVHV